MIITDSQIRLSAEHQHHEERETNPVRSPFTLALDQARIGRALEVVPGAPMPRLPPEFDSPLRLNGTTPPETFQRLFWRLMQALTGATLPLAEVSSPALPTADPGGPALRRGQPRTVRLQVKVFERVEECEATRFGACGQIHTADGAKVDFDLSLEMARRFTRTRSYSREEQVQFKDPLVVNFDGSAADLCGERFDFDLDGDGETESLNRLAEGSGFLALDRDGDGRIGDGTELFGTLSGDGFGDLARFDDDGNGWIDEADSVFDALRIWQPDAREPQLTTLGERGIGALYLGATDTPFSLKDELNHTRGQVRESGIYLTDAGEVGTLQEIDLSV